MPPPPPLARLHHRLSLSLLRGRSPRRPTSSSAAGSPRRPPLPSPEKSSRRTLAYLLGVGGGDGRRLLHAVPLYRRFCQATGYGGTVQRRESVEEEISRHARDGTTTSRTIIAQFNTDVADGMPWKFIPTQ